jgi:hypothetical protein
MFAGGSGDHVLGCDGVDIVVDSRELLSVDTEDAALGADPIGSRARFTS